MLKHKGVNNTGNATSEVRKPYLSIKEAAKQTGISEFALRQWIRGHKIPFIECGKKYLINISGLLEHLEAESHKNIQPGR
jgi:excisionase family DNA binding protein